MSIKQYLTKRRDDLLRDKLDLVDRLDDMEDEILVVISLLNQLPKETWEPIESGIEIPERDDD